jgi:hypothetical protein
MAIAIYSNTTVQFNNSVSSSYMIIPGITAVNGPSLTKGFIDVSSFDSTGFKESKAARLSDPGKLDITMQWSPAHPTHSLIGRRASGAGTEEHFKLTFADGTVYSFSGSFTDLQVTSNNPSEGVVEATLAVKINTAIAGI